MMDAEIQELRKGVGTLERAVQLLRPFASAVEMHEGLPARFGTEHGVTATFTHVVVLDDGTDFQPGEAIYIRQDSHRVWRLWDDARPWHDSGPEHPINLQ